jgi:PAS domain S-box-containing protein
MDNMLQQLLSEAPDAILVADPDGIIRYWNSGAEQIFGYRNSEAIGKSLDLIIPENLRARHWEGYSRVMASGVTKYTTGMLTSPGVKADGSRVSLEFSMVLIKSADGVMQACGSMMRDVTLRWEKEKELKGRLAACEARLVDVA